MMLELLPLGVSAVALVAYVAGVRGLRRRGDRWGAARTWCVVAATCCVAVADLPPVGNHDDVFAVHVAQHLLTAMVAPVLLALSGPVTLALRVAPTALRRRLLRLLRSRPVGVLASPAAAVVLDVGGLYAVYLSGLYQAMESNEVLHAAVHLHMFLTGCLLAWVVVGIDPVRRRGVTVKLGTLVVAGAGHDTLAKLMYAHDLPVGAGTVLARHVGAQLLYYGGTAVELVLAVVVMTQWWRATGRILAHSARRSAPVVAASPSADHRVRGPALPWWRGAR